MTVRPGRYGPYVNHGKVNATLPKGMDPEGVTMDVALPLLAARSGRPAKARPAAKKSAAGKKKPAATGTRKKRPAVAAE